MADAVKHIVHTLIMLWLLKRHLNGLRGHHVTKTTLKSVAAAVATGLAAYGVAWALAPFLAGAGLGARLALVMAGGVAGVAAYSAVVVGLDLKEAKMIPALLFKRRS